MVCLPSDCLVGLSRSMNRCRMGSSPERLSCNISSVKCDGADASVVLLILTGAGPLAAPGTGYPVNRKFQTHRRVGAV